MVVIIFSSTVHDSVWWRHLTVGLYMVSLITYIIHLTYINLWPPILNFCIFLGFDLFWFILWAKAKTDTLVYIIILCAVA